MTIHRPDADCLSLKFAARCDPLAGGDAGMAPFFEALEAHAGEWMPEEVDGARLRKYSRAATLKGMKERIPKLDHPAATLSRESPFVEMYVTIEEMPWPEQFRVRSSMGPLVLLEGEPARAERWCREIVDVVRAWSSSYPVTFARVHAGEDSALAGWKFDSWEAPEDASRDRMKAMHWLNVFGSPWVDALGRERVLSTPAHRIEELPNGAVLLLTRPTLADWRSEEARRAQAKALVHLRPELDFDTVLRELLARSALFEPVEPRFDPDMAPLLQRVANHRTFSERPRKTAELNEYRPPEVTEWLPASAAPPSDVEDPKASIANYQSWADLLAVMLHPDVEDYFKASPEALTDIDYRLWWEKFPELYEREKIDRELFFGVAAYLGTMLVRHLGGRWVPRRNVMESQVVIGDRAWLPFLRTRRYLESTQAVLDYSLTKFYRTAARYHAGQQTEQGAGKA